MKKENIALGLSSIAIAVSIIALCISAYRTPELGFDYMGVLVGILALLVTILIGWQVFNAIQMQTTLREINSRMNKEIDDYDHTVSALVVQLHSIIEYFNKRYYAKAIDRFIYCLDEANKGSRSDEVIEGIFSYLLAIKDEYKRLEEKEKEFQTYIFILKGKREHYINILSKIRRKEASEIIAFISELEEREDFH